MMEEKDKNQQDDILTASIAGAASETVQRYGAATKQHYVAYSGVDNEAGTTLVKGLKQISEETINPDYEFQNIHQQAGFSAEVKDVARSNAENIINGDTTRKVRTDDLGSVNDPLYDTVLIDSDGNIIDSSGAQMKFLGSSKNDPEGLNNAERALDKLQSKKFEKYLDNDVKIDVPSDQYEKILAEADARIENLTKQLARQIETGNTEQAKKIQERIDKLNKIKSNLRKSTVSSDEAVFARMHPKLSTTIDVVKISHRAGLETAKSSALIGGSVSIVKNIVSVYKGECEPEEAVKNIAKDTATTTVFGYSTGFTGAAIKGAMQNSSSEYIRVLSKTNVAGTIVAITVSATKTLIRYFNKEINGVECLETLGEQGTGMIASAMYSVIGQAIIPVPIVGGLIGGMVGYALSSASYGVLLESLKTEKFAYEERMKIEAICEEHIKLIREYRAEIDSIINEYLTDSIEIFRDSFCGIKNALSIGDVDQFIESANIITESLGGNVPFSNTEEFESKILSGTPFKL